jgi:hypothetical protein
MAGLVPAIYVSLLGKMQDVDARHKAGHDGRGNAYNPSYRSSAL